MGLLVALERFAAADDAASNAVLEARLERIASALGNLPGVAKRIMSARETGRVPQLHLSVEGIDALTISRRLQAAPTPVHLSERFAAQGVLIVDAQALRPEDDAALAEAVRKALNV